MKENKMVNYEWYKEMGLFNKQGSLIALFNEFELKIKNNFLAKNKIKEAFLEKAKSATG